MKSQIMVGAAIAVALLSSGCVSRGIPTHGGGKRFFVEQDLISHAAEDCVNPAEVWDFVSGKTVSIQVLSVGDQGGGTQAGGGGFSLSGIFGAAAVIPAGSNAIAGGAAAAQTEEPFKYSAHAAVNAADVELLKGYIIEKVHNSGGRVTYGTTSNEDGTVYVLVSAFGINNSELDILVYSQIDLKAKVAMQAFFVPNPGKAVDNADGSISASAEAIVPLMERRSDTKTYTTRSIIGISLGPAQSDAREND